MKKLYIILLMLAGVFMIYPTSTSGNTPITLSLNAQSNDSITVFARWIPRDDGRGLPDRYEVEWKLHSITIKLHTVVGTIDSLRIQRPADGLSNISVSVRAIRRGLSSNQKTNTIQIPVRRNPPLNDLAIYRMAISQANYGSNTVVENRTALLRIWIRGNSTVPPNVTLRLNNKDTLIVTKPTSFDTTFAAPLSSTYYALVPATFIKQNLEISAILQVLDDTIKNNTKILKPNIKKANILYVALLPVTIEGTTATVTSAFQTDARQWLTRLFPLDSIDMRVIETPLQSTAQTLQFNNANWAWFNVISNIRTWRMSNARISPNYEHVVGVVPVNYSSGTAGMGDRPGRSSAVWDRSSFARVLAHEIGHNLSLPHAPGCGGTNVDVNFPRTNGSIGFPGWNSSAGITAASIIAPTVSDIMNYCSTQHISEYNWEKVFAYRVSSDAVEVTPLAASLIQQDSTIIITGIVVDDSIAISTKESFGLAYNNDDDGEVTIQLSNKTVHTKKMYIDDSPNGETYMFVAVVSKRDIEQSVTIAFLHKNTEIRKIIPINY